MTAQPGMRFGAVKPASARFPVSATSRSKPIRSSISRHSSPVRPSFQRIAGRSDAAARVESDEAVHLAGEPDRGRLDAQVGERRLRRLPPVLLDPAPPIPVAASRTGSRARRGRRLHLSARDRDGLGGGRPDVETDEDSSSAMEPSANPSRAPGAGCCSIRNGRRPPARSPMRRPTTSSSSTCPCSRRMRSTTWSAASASRSPCSSRSTTTHAAPGSWRAGTARAGARRETGPGGRRAAGGNGRDVRARGGAGPGRAGPSDRAEPRWSCTGWASTGRSSR